MGGEPPAVLTPCIPWQQRYQSVKLGAFPEDSGQAPQPFPPEVEHWGASLLDWEGPHSHHQAGRTEGVGGITGKGSLVAGRGNGCSGLSGDTGCPGGMADGRWESQGQGPHEPAGPWASGRQGHRGPHGELEDLGDLSPQRHRTPAGVATRADGL